MEQWKRNTFQIFFQFLFRSTVKTRKTLRYGTRSIPSFGRQINKLKNGTEQLNQYLYSCIRKKIFKLKKIFIPSTSLKISYFSQTEFR